MGSGSYELTVHLGLDCLGTDDPNVAGPTSRKIYVNTTLTEVRCGGNPWKKLLNLLKSPKWTWK
ncbi:hypothetical protein SYK_25600 [Pseudodesulfovibrio nedwellii]|uniref:Uncharacterized protein n=1 Tax=Pseudodesulfovibrio nedwellii TaxID=2973072 RepID=A0ABM8B372_9BACT|nr:hypothetical protein SYK_25600 [Pseudodesulfovibrio nedwellii]